MPARAARERSAVWHHEWTAFGQEICDAAVTSVDGVIACFAWAFNDLMKEMWLELRKALLVQTAALGGKRDKCIAITR